jgi:hypothetical protein
MPLPMPPVPMKPKIFMPSLPQSVFYSADIISRISLSGARVQVKAKSLLWPQKSNPSVINVIDGGAISVPVSRLHEAPVGLTLAMPGGSDKRLFQTARIIETAIREKGTLSGWMKVLRHGATPSWNTSKCVGHKRGAREVCRRSRQSEKALPFKSLDANSYIRKILNRNL